MLTATPRRIVLLAYEDMNVLDLTGPLQVFVTANRVAVRNGAPPYITMVASARGGAVLTSAGLLIDTLPTAALDKLDIDTLIAAGGCKDEEYLVCAELAAWIAQRAAGVRRLCSVCTGAFLLAAAGQLSGRRVATHWAWAERLQERHPDAQVEPDPLFIEDGAVWTSAGVTAGIDMSLALVGADLGHQVAIETARQMVMFIKRSGAQPQVSVPLAAQARGDASFADLHAWIAAHIGENIGVERLAAVAGMAPRTFARVYAAKVGRTPAKTVEAMRLEAACRALETSNLPMKAIADAVGYAQEQNLRRAFHRQFGMSPLQYRERFAKRSAA
jgi:transcriptional regulator GlxA family with amidase domain